MADLGTAVLRLTTDNRELEQGMGRAEGRGRSLNRTLMRYLGPAAMAGIGAGAVRLALQFDTSMTRIETLVGLSREQVQGMRADVMTLSGQTARAPRELADALFVVTSAGERGAGALEVLESAAKASAIGLGSTESIARTVTAAMQAYGSENLDAARATNILVGTVREGNLESSALAASLGRVLGPASQLGVSMEDLGAFLATYTRLGISAEEATTGLQAVLNLMIKPSAQAQDALEGVGLSMSDIRAVAAGDGGLAAALDLIISSFDGNLEAIGEVIPNVRALSGVLGTAGAQAETYAGIQQALRGQLNLVDEGFERVQQTAEFKLNKALNDLKVVGTDVGVTVLPAVAMAASGAAVGIGLMSDAAGPLAEHLPTLALAAGGLVIALNASKLLAAAQALNQVRIAALGLVAANPVLLATVGAFVALDVGLRTLTGSGLIERVVGGFRDTDHAAKGAAQAVEDLERALAGRQGEQRIDVIFGEIERAIRAINDAERDRQRLFGEGADIDFGPQGTARLTFYNNLTDAIDGSTGALETHIQALLDEGASSRQLLDVYNMLPQAQQAVIYESGLLAHVFAEQANQAADVEAALYGYADGATGAERATQDLSEAAGESVDKMAPFWSALEDGAEAASAARSQLNLLVDALQATDPEYVSNAATIATLNIQIADLESRTGELTDAEQAHLDSLIEQRDALGLQQRAFEANTDALQPLLANISLLTGIGPGSLNDLTGKMNDSGMSAHDLAGFWGGINTAFEETDGQAAIDEIVRVFDEIDDPQMAIDAATDLVPAFIDKLVEDGAAPETVSKAQLVGSGIMAGFGTGMLDEQGNVSETALDIMGTAMMYGVEHFDADGAGQATVDRTATGVGNADRTGLDTATGGVVTGAVDAGVDAPDYNAKGIDFVALVGSGISNADTASVTNAGASVGSAAMQGVGSGAQSQSGWIAGQFISIVRSAIERARGPEGIDAGSPSRLTAAVLGLPMAQGIVEGIQQGEDEVGDALTALIRAVMDAAEQSRLVDAYGQLGARVVSAFIRAVEDDTPSAGAALARAVEQIFDHAENVGQPLSEAQGERLMRWLAWGIENGSQDAIEAVIAVMAGILDEIDAGVEQAQLTIADFWDVFADIEAAKAREEDIGRAGVAFMDALLAAIDEGGERNLTRLAQLMAGMRDSIVDGLPPAQGAYLASLFMDAFNHALEVGSDESIAELERMMAIINSVLNGGAIDIRTGTIVIAEDIKALADAIGISADDIVKNIGLFIDHGLFNLIGGLQDLTEEGKEAIAELVQAWIDGLITITDVAAGVDDIVKGGDGKPGGSSRPPGTGNVGEDPLARILQTAEHLGETSNSAFMQAWAAVRDGVLTVADLHAAGLNALASMVVGHANKIGFDLDAVAPSEPDDDGVTSGTPAPDAPGTPTGGEPVPATVNGVSGHWVDVGGNLMFIPDDVPSFGMGGVVPGPVGAPVLAMVHGGETILPTHTGGGDGASPMVTLNATFNIEGDADETKIRHALEEWTNQQFGNGALGWGLRP